MFRWSRFGSGVETNLLFRLVGGIIPLARQLKDLAFVPNILDQPVSQQIIDGLIPFRHFTPIASFAEGSATRLNNQAPESAQSVDVAMRVIGGCN